VFANFTVGEIYLDIATSAKPLTERIYSSNTALGTHAECNIRVAPAARKLRHRERLLPITHDSRWLVVPSFDAAAPNEKVLEMMAHATSGIVEDAPHEPSDHYVGHSP
jgi:hypothetical protein